MNLSCNAFARPHNKNNLFLDTAMSTSSQNDLLLAPSAQKSDVAQPDLFEVVLHNDDYTTMDFVIEVICRFFYQTAEVAEKLMLKVHFEGSAVVGIFPRDIAETKARQVVAYAREKGHPLMCSIRPQ